MPHTLLHFYFSVLRTARVACTETGIKFFFMIGYAEYFVVKLEYR